MLDQKKIFFFLYSKVYLPIVKKSYQFLFRTQPCLNTSDRIPQFLFQSYRELQMRSGVFSHPCKAVQRRLAEELVAEQVVDRGQAVLARGRC